MTTELYGDLHNPGCSYEGSRSLQRIYAVMKAEQITEKRFDRKEWRPIGIPFLRWELEESMKHDRNIWPTIPSPEGLRKRIQELADPRYFFPTPLLHLPMQMKDIDPETTSGPYSVCMRPTSCYLLNPTWYLEQGIWDKFDTAKEFAFKIIKVSNMPDLKAVFRGREVDLPRLS